jgi:hypothetical protein
MTIEVNAYEMSEARVAQFGVVHLYYHTRMLLTSGMTVITQILFMNMSRACQTLGVLACHWFTIFCFQCAI